MKTTLTTFLSIKQFSALIAVFLLSGFSVFGQTFTPQYNNNNNATPTGGNSIPFSWNSNGVRGQWLIPANIFVDANGNGAPGGKAIKTIYIYPTSGTFSSPVIYNNMVIKIGQPSITTLSGTWHTAGMQTAVNATTFSITGGMNQWCEIPLTNKINYDPSKPLVLDVAWTSQRTYNLFYVANKSYTNAARNWATPSTASSGSSGASWMGIIGMDLVSLGPNNAGVSALTSPNNFCPGTYAVNVDIANSGTNQLDSVRVHWTLDGVLQKTIKHKTLIDTSGAKNGNTANIFLDSVTFGNAARIIKIWTSFPNGVKDTVNDDDTLEVRLRSAMSGSFTIGGSNPDYLKISDATKDLSTFGVCGPVSFDIRAGTYTERVVLNNVSGASSTNTITFKGAGRGQTIVDYSTGSSTGDMAAWLVEGTDYVKITD
ncbi:MAG: hypothetical protein KDC92_08145, partial [Bacteroidetes bacterium]|nr:hypothetical protein [Bacteroidota bacterium]